jgi:hypothetical protein
MATDRLDENTDIEKENKEKEDVDRYGYYFLFLRNLPRYTEKIWDLYIADYLQLMPIKEKRKKKRSWPQRLTRKVE